MEILEHVPLSGPFGLEMKVVSTSSLLQLVEAALTHNTPVPLYSNATLLGAASDVRERIGTLENAIDTLQDFVKDLRDRKTEHVKLQHALERAGSRELDPFPPIPLDLAQKIIQEAASLDMATASNLCSVSKLVQTWSDERLLQEISLRTEAESLRISSLVDQPSFCTSPRARWITSVAGFPGSNLLKTFTAENTFSLPCLTSFSCWDSDRVFTLSGAMCPSLHRLACDPRIFSNDGFLSNSPDFTQPIFRSVTHLECLYYQIESPWDWSSLRSLTELTHLDVYQCERVQGTPAFIQPLLLCLPNSLRLGILHLFELPDGQFFEDLYAGHVDPRVLIALTVDDITKMQERPWILYMDDNIDSCEQWAGLRAGETVWNKGIALLEQRAAHLKIDSSQEIK
ncbi:hypothetical protein DL96DRAFT_1811722 [Flagelloscypha sp. PMI_526]|nr:hypothetical protein DL96DRAFT_1811722 [Flagelloscypha sp. PMI_526]